MSVVHVCVEPLGTGMYDINEQNRWIERRKEARDLADTIVVYVHNVAMVWCCVDWHANRCWHQCDGK